MCLYSDVTIFLKPDTGKYCRCNECGRGETSLSQRERGLLLGSADMRSAAVSAVSGKDGYEEVVKKHKR